MAQRILWKGKFTFPQMPAGFCVFVWNNCFSFKFPKFHFSAARRHPWCHLNTVSVAALLLKKKKKSGVIHFVFTLVGFSASNVKKMLLCALLVCWSLSDTHSAPDLSRSLRRLKYQLLWWDKPIGVTIKASGLWDCPYSAFILRSTMMTFDTKPQNSSSFFLKSPTFTLASQHWPSSVSFSNLYFLHSLHQQQPRPFRFCLLSPFLCVLNDPVSNKHH